MKHKLASSNTNNANQGFIAVAVIVLVLVVGAGYLAYRFVAGRQDHAAPNASTGRTSPATNVDSQLTIKESDGQVTVTDASGAWLAKFTKGARTVVMPGPSRTFSEPSSTSVTIANSDWVPIYPKAFTGTVDRDWLAKTAALNAAKDPDLLAIAMQYIVGAPPIKDVQGRVIASDASFGPGLADGDRQEGSDFNDFLGVAYDYGASIDKPEPKQIGSLDCSGFIRMIWGYRSGIQLELEPTGAAIPRRAYQILASAPGTTIAADTGRRLGEIPPNLQSGDVLFFNVEADDGPRIDHMGVYLGLDSDGSHRFISSRKVANGPTFGDIAGRSVIDGNGFFAKSLRAVRRF